VLEHGWRRLDHLAEAAREQRAENPSLYNTILRMGSKEVGDFLAWVWMLEGVPEEPTRDRIEKLQVASNSVTGRLKIIMAIWLTIFNILNADLNDPTKLARLSARAGANGYQQRSA